MVVARNRLEVWKTACGIGSRLLRVVGLDKKQQAPKRVRGLLVSRLPVPCYLQANPVTGIRWQSPVNPKDLDGLARNVRPYITDGALDFRYHLDHDLR